MVCLRPLALLLAVGFAAAAFVAHTSQRMAGVTVILGSGATFPQPQLERWIDEYGRIRGGVLVDYVGKGSGGGQNDFLMGLVDFAMTDPPLGRRVWSMLEEKGGARPLQFPVVAGAIAVVYNLPGVEGLRLDGETLALVFMGRIAYWDDPRIVGQNPGLPLPHEEIVVIHRSDSSGTTMVFTTYLSMVSETWRREVGAGKAVDWPVDRTGRGVGGRGNPGVALAVMNNPFSIGYLEHSYALKEGLQVALIRNREGRYVAPSREAVEAVLRGVAAHIPPPQEGWREDLSSLLNPPGPDAYPIVAVSHILVWSDYGDPVRTREVRMFVKWVLTEGQGALVPGYVGLPPGLAERLLEEAGWDDG